MEKDPAAKEIMERIARGETRESISAQLGYISYRSLDMKMRRKCHRWDARLNNYVYSESLEQEKEAEEPAAIALQADMIAGELSEPNADPKVIARRYGFHDHKELAIYMKCQGYEWNSSNKRYVKTASQSEAFTGRDHRHTPGHEFNAHDEEDADIPTQSSEPVKRPRPVDELERYRPVLQLLLDQKYRLEEILSAEEPARPNRSHVNSPAEKQTERRRGMAVALNDILSGYCSIRGLPTVEALESIITEFLNRYGYDYEVNLIKKR